MSCWAKLIISSQDTGCIVLSSTKTEKIRSKSRHRVGSQPFAADSEKKNSETKVPLRSVDAWALQTCWRGRQQLRALRIPTRRSSCPVIKSISYSCRTLYVNRILLLRQHCCLVLFLRFCHIPILVYHRSPILSAWGTTHTVLPSPASKSSVDSD